MVGVSLMVDVLKKKKKIQLRSPVTAARRKNSPMAGNWTSQGID
jgi:hypothetical protein